MSVTGASLDALRAWVGRSEQASTLLSVEPLQRLAATLDYHDPELTTPIEVPPLWHWVYFLPHHATAELGPDGHAARGGFLPPVPLPRRMWAGGRITFHRPLAVGESAERVSTVTSVEAKQGRSGALVFVTLRHAISSAGELALVEEQDLVYREVTPGVAALAVPAAAPTDETHCERRVADDPLLFRYSALTFNSHRIHYDRRYVTEVEGYPGLIVHGPLIATLLVHQVRVARPGVRLASFEFRAERPIFDGTPFDLCARNEGECVALWARDASGAVAMRASAKLEAGAALADATPGRPSQRARAAAGAPS
jgi:3-methylfumaryl-CoA hydratase